MVVKLYVILVSCVDEKLKILFTPSAEKTSYDYAFPSITLDQEMNLHSGVKVLLNSCLSSLSVDERELWFNSAQCRDRIVDVYDKVLLSEQNEDLSIVRCVSVPLSFASHCQGYWLEPTKLIQSESSLAPDCRIFLRGCLSLIPLWVKNSTFIFELLPHVFSIQDLRILLGLLSSQEIDPGNFHRRLKKLDILKPLSSGLQRVHRWEFSWERSNVLLSDGLIP